MSAASTNHPTMRAVVQSRYGARPHEVLELADAAVPVAGEGQVLIEVRAASVDRGTWHVMAGLPYAVRLAGFGVRRPAALNPGRSVAGVVAAIGANVEGVAPGDEVYGVCEGGSFAEFALANVGKVTAKPANLTFEEAAAVPVSGLTAVQAVRDHAMVEPGDRVLVIGASGGVGTFAVQIAAAFGAEVTAVCGTAKVDAVRALGATRVIDYRSEDFVDGTRYDVILDVGGCNPLPRLRSALTPRGRLVIVGGMTEGRWFGGVDRQVRARLLSPFVGQRLVSFVNKERAADLDVLRTLIEGGQVRPAVDATYPLDGTARAIQDLIDGRVVGKAVVSVRRDGGFGR